MSLDDYISSGQQRFHSPNSLNEWMPKDFPEDNFFLDGSFDPPLNFTADEERLFRSFGDAFDSGQPSSSEGNLEAMDERQAVFAEAQAAGLFKGGIRRAAFSMGDLQALQPPDPNPPPPRGTSQRPPLPTGASKPPKLESVPESKALPVSSPLFGEELDLGSHVSGLTTGGLSDGQIDSLTLDQLSADLAAGMPSNFDSQDVPMTMFGSGMQSEGANLSGMPPMIKSEPAEGMSMASMYHPQTRQMDLSQDFPPASGPLYDFPYSQGPSPMPGSLTKIEEGSQLNLGGPEASGPLAGFPESSHLVKPTTSQALPKSNTPASRGEESKEFSREKEREQQRQRMLRRSQSAVELRATPIGMTRNSSTGDLKKLPFTVELTNPEGQTYIAGRLSNEERAQKILRYRQKRHERNFKKRIKYMCRKTLADSRPRVRGRFARNDDSAAVMPHETKKALAEKARKEKKATAEAAAAAAVKASQEHAHQWNDDTGLADPLDMTFPDLDPQAGEGAFGDMFPSTNSFSFPSLPSGLVYTGRNQLNDSSEQYRNS